MLDAAKGMEELRLRVELLRGLAMKVSAPAKDDKGRYWFFVTARVGEELCSVPLVLVADRYDRDAFMEVFQRVLENDLSHMGFDVLHDDKCSEIGRLL
jgi:hypothetical protein